jgi:hypothetical protein
MLRARTDTAAGPIFLLGLTKANVHRLTALRDPVLVDLGELGGRGRVTLLYGEDETAIVADLERAGVQIPTALRAQARDAARAAASMRDEDPPKGDGSGRSGQTPIVSEPPLASERAVNDALDALHLHTLALEKALNRLTDEGFREFLASMDEMGLQPPPQALVQAKWRGLLTEEELAQRMART